MNNYLMVMSSGVSLEIEAELYLGDGVDLVFMAGEREVFRTAALDVMSISKAR